MRAIVTGGAGFIGAHLSRRLLQHGWSVLVLDNLSSGFLRNVPEGAEFKWVDLTLEDAMEELPKDGADVVFHLASHVGQELSFDRPIYDLKANAVSTLVLLKWCLDHGVKQLVFASSMNVYGNPATLPITEDTPVDPPSPYAVGKIASEYLCRVYEAFGVQFTAFRLFNVYGPMQDMQNMKQGMVSIFMSYVARGEPVLIRGSRDRFRDFVYVHDVVDAFYRAVDPRAYGKIYNVATGRRTHVGELIDQIIRVHGHDPATYPITFGEPTRQDQFGVFGDSSKLTRELGWKPRVVLEDGLREMAEWVRQHGIL